MKNKLEEYKTISELLQLNEEGTRQEFKPKFGIGAERNSNANEKAVKDILKSTEEYNEKARKEFDRRNPTVEFEDFNKTTLDANYDYEPDKSYKERVKKLATTGLENDKAEYYSTEGNEKFYDERKEMRKNRAKREENERIKGIVGRNNHDHKAKDYSDNTAFIGVNEGVVTKRLKFKNTIFLSEAQVLSHVPDDYKTDSNRFYMQDKTGTDYIVECVKDQFGCMHVSVNGKYNKGQINEELDKMRRLADYSYYDDNVKVDKNKMESMNESIDNFRCILNNNSNQNN